MTAAEENPALGALRAASARLETAGDDDGDPRVEAEAFEAVHAALVAVLADVDGT